MRLHDNLDLLLSHGSKVKILRFLFSERDEHTGRGIAGATNMGVSSAYRLLQEMREAGIISARRKGNAILYKLKDDNYFAKKLIIPLFEKEQAVYGDVISCIKRGLLVDKGVLVSIAIFGSVVRGEETGSSDIDLAVIVKNDSGKVALSERMDKINIDIAKKFGAAISPYILTKAEIIKKYNQKQPLVVSIMKNNRLIYGEPMERILA